MKGMIVGMGKKDELLKEIQELKKIQYEILKILFVLNFKSEKKIKFDKSIFDCIFEEGHTEKPLDNLLSSDKTITIEIGGKRLAKLLLDDLANHGTSAKEEQKCENFSLK